MVSSSGVHLRGMTIVGGVSAVRQSGSGIVSRSGKAYVGCAVELYVRL